MNGKRVGVLFILVLACILSGCSALDTVKNIIAPVQRQTLSDEQVLDAWLMIAAHEPYLEASGINTHFASERKSTIKKAQKVAVMEAQYIVWENAVFDDHYAVSATQTSYTYYGDTKKNRPHGFGMMVSIENGEQIIEYIGNFKKGNFDGYGILFDSFDTDPYLTAKGLAQEGMLDASQADMAAEYLRCYMSYDGKWKNGRRSGKGNEYELNLATILSSPTIKEYWGGALYPSVRVGEYKKGKLTGSVKLYEASTLVYDGKMKKGMRAGKGTSYYLNGQKQYTGEWKNNSYHGRGKLYDESGSMVYSGKWKNGDYAS